LPSPRATTLDAQSLWAHEGLAYARATLPSRDVVSNLLLVGEQTPLYDGVVQLWTAWVGHSAFVLRLHSVGTAILMVPVVRYYHWKEVPRNVGVSDAAAASNY
jgi:hypothetical protein